MTFSPLIVIVSLEVDVADAEPGAWLAERTAASVAVPF
jgi:hypothetical protein